jgi:hypothetical protein
MKSAYAVVLGILFCVGAVATGMSTRDAAVPATESRAVSSAEPQAQTRLVADFSAFAGSDSNARSLVAGLRQGSEITLAPAGGRAGPAAQFAPPSRPMDFGNVRIALVLAREQLAQFGITRPNPAQLKAVLVGGGVASRANDRVATPVLLPGVLQMRAGGMGWQPIASSMGITLAQAMSGSEHREDPAAAPQDPIASASITTSSAGAPRTLPTMKPIVAFPRWNRVDPEPEKLRARGSVLAAVDGPPRGDTITDTAQERAPAEATEITVTAKPAAPLGPVEEKQEVD